MEEAPAAPSPPDEPGRSEPDAPLDPLSACDVLGVPPTADADTVEKAFRERALLCHPDKVAHLDPEIQALADRKFRRLKEARELLLGES